MERTATVEIQREHSAARADFASVVDVYRARVFRFALASLRDRDAADTVTQDCFLKAYRAWETFRQDCSMDTWLMQIAVNLVRDHTRNRRLRFWRQTALAAKPIEAISGRVSDGGRSPEAQALVKERVDAVWDAASSLPERQRTVFLLRFVEDMDLLEIAAATGMQEGTVKSHLFRALKAIRERMGARV